MWLSHEPIPGSIEALGRLRAGDRPLVFVTNDPRSTRAEHADRLSRLGAPTEPEQIVTSATATAHRVAEAHPGGLVLAVGTDSLARDLEARGLEPIMPADLARAPGQVPDAVVIGGGAAFDFEVLHLASAAAREGAELWATNKDPTYPSARGLTPGTGAIVAAIEVAAGVEAINVGKPEPALFEEALEMLGVERSRAGDALMAGDSLHSDIAGAGAAGMATAFVLTGRDSRADIAAAPQAPDYVFADLAAVADAVG